MMDKNYLFRLASFVKWKLDLPLFPTEMADNGLWYTEEGDKVKCFKCGAIIGNWQAGDSVIDRHRQASPGCELVQELMKLSEPIGLLHALNVNSNSSNLNTTDGGNEEETDASRPIVTSGTSGDIGAPSRIIAGSNSNRNVPVAATTLNNSVVSTDRIDATDMKHEAARLATFNNWPKSDVVKPESLARNGFFYKGFGDNTECAFCAGVLRAWELGDEPSREHKNAFPECPFVCGQNVGNVPIARRGQYAVDPREIKARLDTPQVQMFVSQGHSLDAIRSVIEDRLRIHGSDFPSAIEFLVALSAKRHELSMLNTSHGLAALTGASSSLVVASNNMSTSLGAGVVSSAAIGENFISAPVIGGNSRGSTTGAVAVSSNAPTTSAAATAQQLSGLPDAMSSMQLATGRDSPAAGKAKKKKKKKSKNGCASTTTVAGTATVTVTNATSATALGADETLAVTGVVGKDKVAHVVEQQQPQAVAQGSSSMSSKNDDSRLCSICQCQDVNIAFVPCGHACTCGKCAGKVTQCPICRKLIKERIRIYLS